ncbi:ABC transporter permease [Clostridium cylindrosporum]|uniref:ABC-type proline/glycine betaine transport system, permease component n=1 Tax=Clostridium cylindrosporum DSM 605 TaxID=1121307 RepID=A0A0J8DFA1_CLOCY|nr:ABC transporter permease [Clostridium cylindrosporum]KMT22929.1 ABC-type proline/glycine betaine transport system, permease component [Clostridium cylindrosporum DSM 605]
MSGKIDKVLSVLTLFSIMLLFSPNFINFKKMRIQTSVSLSANTCLGSGFKFILIGCIIIFLLSLVRKRYKYTGYFCGLLAGILIIVTLYYMSNALKWLPLDKTPYSRLTIGLTMWIWLFVMYGIIIKSLEGINNKFQRYSIIFIPLALLIILLITHNLSGLGIVMEYESKKDRLWLALIKHIEISISVIASAILIGVPLGYLINRSQKLDKIIFSILNITETLPAISFIAILMIPLYILSNKFHVLRKMGISGFGVAPAFIALLFYALFPILHNTRAAFKSIDKSYLETAQSMGMRYGKIFLSIEVPIALPIILSGIRLAVIYTISAVSLAAFTGGGGLGVFLVERESMDLMILGILPIVIVTFLFDSFIKIIIEKTKY